FPTLMTVAMSGASRADAGLASGLINTAAQVGGALGLAVLATLSASRAGALAHRESSAAALTGGYHLAFWVAAALAAAAIAVALVVVRAPAGIEPALGPTADEPGRETVLSEAGAA
ncbi:MAG: MFS transporter, partial [Isosphaeraceae bacterium]